MQDLLNVIGIVGHVNKVLEIWAVDFLELAGDEHRGHPDEL